MHLFKNQLTNSDQHVQDKARYFADCFDFYLRHLGKFGFPALETQRSLLEKIGFQLHRYDNYSKKYISHHAINKLLDSKDRMINGYYKSMFPLIMDLRKHRYTDAVERTRIIAGINMEILKLQKTLSKNALKEVIDVMHCPEPLCAHEHLKIIDYCTAIIVSEFLFAGFPTKDLENLMSKILTKEVRLKKNKTVTEFPLPENLTNHPKENTDPEQFYEIVQTFMENRSLREQFDGIYNWFVAKPAPCVTVVRILNVSSLKQVSKTYGKVTMTGNIRSVLTGDKNKRAGDFMAKEGQLYFKVQFGALSFEAAEQTAYDLLNKELPKFENYFGNRLYIDYSGIVIKLADRYYHKTSYAAQRIAQPDPKINREEKALQKLTSEAAQIFLHQEALYSLAKMTELKELKISYYWTYLESFFPMEGVDAERIQKDVAEIVANSDVFFITSDLFLVAHEILMAWRHEGIHNESHDLDYMALTKFLNINRVTAPWLENAMDIANHPFLNTHLKPLMKQKVNITKAKLVQFYASVLFETFEQRNFVQHAGIYHPMALDKILRCLPEVVRHFRSLILHEIKKNRHSTMEAVLTQLKQPSPKLKEAIKNNAATKELLNA